MLVASAGRSEGPASRSWEAMFDSTVSAMSGSLARSSCASRTAAFTDTAAAVECAIRLQRLLSDRDVDQANEEASAHVALALHTGEVIREGDSVYGRNVVLACRLADHAAPGEVLATRPVLNALAGATAERFRVAGSVALVGVRDPQELFRVAWREGGVDPEGG